MDTQSDFKAAVRRQEIKRRENILNRETYFEDTPKDLAMKGIDLHIIIPKSDMPIFERACNHHQIPFKHTGFDTFNNGSATYTLPNCLPTILMNIGYTQKVLQRLDELENSLKS